MVSPNCTIGALIVGALVSTFLFGITTLQTYIYVGRFTEDRAIVKVMVFIVWILEFAHTIAVSNGLYYMIMASYTDPTHQAFVQGVDIDSGFRIAIFFSGCIAALVQAYFAHRLRIMCEQIIIPVIFYFLATVRLCGWIGVSIAGITRSTLRPMTMPVADTWGWPLVPLLAAGAGVDIVLAGIICYHFHATRTKVGGSAPLMDKLMLWTIQNGLMTGLAGIVTVICLVTMKDNFIWIAVLMVLTRLFSNSFLASLNARQQLRKYRHHANPSFASVGTNPYSASQRTTTPSGKIDSNTQPYLYIRADTPATVYTTGP
ncbi:hypothetical protein AX16_007020 [Volvariella volvacea WC 439]|nr:hypothetical protein AX16_007020 [Volvariella volvacea WC 439]